MLSTMGIVENIIDTKPDVANTIVQNTDLMQFLVKRVDKAKPFDANKLYASELLSILLQADEDNQQKLASLDGLEALLQAVSVRAGRAESYHVDARTGV